MENLTRKDTYQCLTDRDVTVRHANTRSLGGRSRRSPAQPADDDGQPNGEFTTIGIVANGVRKRLVWLPRSRSSGMRGRQRITCWTTSPVRWTRQHYVDGGGLVARALDRLPLPSSLCPRCGSLAEWIDLMGARHCQECEAGTLEKSLRLAELAARLREQAHAPTPAPRIATGCVAAAPPDALDLGSMRPSKGHLYGPCGT